jgi:hypothetical protein
MNFYGRRFNLYLLPLWLCLLAAGCALWPHKHKKEPTGIVRVCIESEASTAGPTKTITVLRSQPVAVNISTEPILTEADMLAARLLETPGNGFAVELKFQETAGWRLEQYTAINPGKHLAIFGQWGETPADGRWLAAPLISRRIATSDLIFTPDASRHEADQWVKGLNAVAKKNTGVKSNQ